MCSVLSFAKNNSSTCQQIEDVIHNGKKYMQFVFSDPQGNYTAGYLESYNDPSNGSLFCSIDPIPVKNPSLLHMQQLEQFHKASIACMKQHAASHSQVTQRQQVDKLFIERSITSEQAMAYYQQIEYAPLIAQAQKKQKIYVKNIKINNNPVRKIKLQLQL